MALRYDYLTAQQELSEERVSQGQVRGGSGGVLGGLARRLWLPALALVAVTGLVIAVNPAELGGVLRRSRPLPLVLMAPTTVGVYVLRGLGWWVALRQIGVDISPPRAVQVILASKPLVFLPAGDLGRVAILELTVSKDRDVGEVSATVAYQELLFLLLMGLVTIPICFQQPAVTPVVVGLAVLAGGIFWVLFWEPAYDRAVGLIVHIGVLRRFDRELRHIRPSFLALFTSRTLAGVLCFNAAALALAFLDFELALAAVGVEGVTYVQAAFIYALAYVLSGLAFTPAGLGAYEAILTGFMALEGVRPSVGAAAAILYRGYNDLFMAALGSGFLLHLRQVSRLGRMPGQDA